MSMLAYLPTPQALCICCMVQSKSEIVHKIGPVIVAMYGKCLSMAYILIHIRLDHRHHSLSTLFFFPSISIERDLRVRNCTFLIRWNFCIWLYGAVVATLRQKSLSIGTAKLISYAWCASSQFYWCLLWDYRMFLLFHI